MKGNSCNEELLEGITSLQRAYNFEMSAQSNFVIYSQ
jgi:hypothetical protein